MVATSRRGEREGRVHRGPLDAIVICIAVTSCGRRRHQRSAGGRPYAAERGAGGGFFIWVPIRP
jgi:hypothetical protein